MIYGNSNDPVLIKKISLRIWTLRAELEAVIEERMQNSEAEVKPRLDDLMKEYKSKGTIAAMKEEAKVEEIGIKDISELDDSGEDEMAKALAEAEAQEANEGTDEETPQEASDNSDNKEAEQQAPEEVSKITQAQLEIGLDKAEGKNLVKQRIPSIDESKVSVGKAILAEIYMEQMFFFSSKPFLVGQSIVLDFLVPRRFVMNADVTFCRTYNMKSRIISQNRLTYRVGVKFTFLKEGERTILREFTKSIQPDFDATPVKEVPKDEAAPSGGGGGGDDFDIFDDLDD